jgi:hypothetical protein
MRELDTVCGYLRFCVVWIGGSWEGETGEKC